MTMPHLMNCAHDENGWCLDCVEELWSKTQIPPEMLEAATAAMLKSQEYGTGESPTVYTQEAFQAANLAATWRRTERYAQAALEAAGVPALLAEHDAAMAMLAANDIYDTSLTDRISVLLERCRTARQGAVSGWKAAEQYLTDSEKMRILLDEQRQAKRQAECAYDHLQALKTSLTARIAELERELEIARTGGSE